MPLESQNVCLDTSVFFKKNFQFSAGQLATLSQHAQDGLIFIYGAIRLTPPHTTCSMWAWLSTRGRLWSLKSVFTRTTRVVNTFLICDGRRASVVLGVVLAVLGERPGDFTCADVAVSRSL